MHGYVAKHTFDHLLLLADTFPQMGTVQALSQHDCGLPVLYTTKV